MKSTAGSVAINLTNIILPKTRFLFRGGGLLESYLAKRRPELSA